MTSNKSADMEIIERFTKGDLDAFQELVSKYEAKVFNLAMRYTRNREDSEEVLQDVFVTVYKKVRGFEGKAAFSSWLYRVTVNAACMKLRKRKQDRTIAVEDLTMPMHNRWLDEDESLQYQSDAETVSGELRSVLQSAISRLPEEYRVVFVLRDVDGLANKEVAEILDLTVAAVKSRLHRARLMLRKKLQYYYDDYCEPTEVLAIGAGYLQDKSMGYQSAA